MNVSRLSPRRLAAPFAPQTRPSASLRAWMISLRSTSARILRTGRRLVDLELASSLAGTVIVRGCNSATGTFNVGPDDKITARSITFCSSRMLPGQLYWHKAFIVSEANHVWPGVLGH